MIERNAADFDYKKFLRESLNKVISPVSASFAILPSFYWFARKAAIQSSSPIPLFNFQNTIVGGLKTVPVISSTVGLQLILQELIEGKISQTTAFNNWQSSLLASSIVGFLTAIPLGVFQGQTLGITIKHSFKLAANPKSICLIGLRESGFIAAVQASAPLAKLLNSEGDNLALQNLTYFTTSAGASYLTQPLDSLATRTFKSSSVSKSLYSGAASRAVASGIFNVAYQAAKNLISKQINSEHSF